MNRPFQFAICVCSGATLAALLAVAYQWSAQ